MMIVKGGKYKSDDGKAIYKIISISPKNRTVSFVSTTNKKAASVIIPDYVIIGGVKYKVTAVEKKALTNLKVKKIIIGKNVKKIGAKAFYGCRKLKNLIIKTKNLKAKNVGKKTFAKTQKKIKISIPKKKYMAYRLLLCKRGISMKAKFIRN